jgi:hypothetical protein
MEGVVLGESPPRWHDGRLWFSDWGANQVLALGTRRGHGSWSWRRLAI